MIEKDGAENPEDVFEMISTSYEQVASSREDEIGMIGFGVVKRFSHRVFIKPAKKVSSSVYGGAKWLGGKAKTVVVSAAKAALKTAKLGVGMIAKPLGAIGKYLLIGGIALLAVVVLMFLRKQGFIARHGYFQGKRRAVSQSNQKLAMFGIGALLLFWFLGPLWTFILLGGWLALSKLDVLPKQLDVIGG